MRTLIISGIALLALAGCATSQPASEWRQVNGAWVGPATTYQSGSGPTFLPGRANDCADYQTDWHRVTCIGLDAANRYFIEIKPGLDALNKLK